MTRTLLVLGLLVGGCTAQGEAGIDPGGPGGGPGGPDGGFPFDEGFPIDGDFFGGPQPQFGNTVTQAVPPPPLSGGTLTVLADGHTAIAADPDRDHVYVVDVDKQSLVADVALQAGDEPGRNVADAAGRVHVALRSGGALVTLDPTTWTVSARRSVCMLPRGVAYEAATDTVHVACAGGELVSLPAAGGAATRTLQLDRDLRDVVVDGGKLLVTRFKTAELLVVNADGTVGSRLSPPTFAASGFSNDSFSPSVAWRALPQPGGGALVVHQRGTLGTVVPKPGGYGSGFGGCDGIVQSTITPLQPGVPPPETASIAGVVLPIDLALSPDGKSVAVVSAGNAHTPGLPNLSVFTRSDVVAGPSACQFGGEVFTVSGEPTAVAYAADGRILVQTREPATVQVLPSGSAPTLTINTSTVSRADTGHAIFQSNAGGGIACASCHAEGGEDGRVWTFDGIGPRRTQSVRGGLAGTEPFHWDGDEANLGALVTDVFVGRMSGPHLASDQLGALSGFLESLPDLPDSPPADPQAVDRGRVLFNDAQNVGCGSCHSGPKLTNHATVDVGTGGMFQVPALHGVAWRAPFLHDGRAPTLTARFGAGGGGNLHGHTSQLTSAQISDLVAFLNAL
jgi:hypothetical protein